ncbi:MAG TPA: IS630 family transposase [Acidimicrobiales bacterium]|nr:IS630 family transposase [Acidimicrobiales bacterium]
MTVMVAPALEVTDDQRQQLEAMSRSSSIPHRKVIQAKALLWAADGVANEEIARRCDTTPDTVRRWRARFAEQGIAGVGTIAPGRGRKPGIPPDVIEAIVHDTLHERPDDDSTHWSTRTMADRHGVGKDTVARIWRARRLKPWLAETFKLSNDPRFEEKLVDVVGLYLDPPERAVVLCFDEKTQTQALDRTQPSLPLKPGRAGTMTHDYKRNGTVDLFAALNAATGEVLTHCRRRHTHRDFLFFLKLIDLHVPRGLEVHLVLDNLSVHTHPDVERWLAHPKRKRFHLHFTPTSSSWLNLVERWFKELTDKRLRRGSFGSVAELVDAIELWASHWNDDPKPFMWHKTAEEIIAKVKRGRAALAHQIKSATDH